ncbi:MAG TPA: 50S ribosomal protein L25 [Candidatus Omnitrophica bacterium]|nr:50S ribosomal protein L25 [Candidatus Omnitrophota bacterium]
MEAIYLEAEVREDSEVGKSHLLRKNNFVPCIVYGEGKKTVPLKIDRGRLIKFMHAHHGGENMVITLKVASSSDKKTEEKAVLIKELQTHPVSGDILHVDFNEISLTKRIEVKVPVASKGEAVGVKQDGGTLEHIIWEIEVECLPTQIPEKIEVDVTNLKIGDYVHVKDLVVPEGVIVKHEQDAIVFSLVPPHKEELAGEAAVGEAATSAEPEVIKKEKKPVEGEEEAGKPEAK